MKEKKVGERGMCLIAPSCRRYGVGLLNTCTLRFSVFSGQIRTRTETDIEMLVLKSTAVSSLRNEVGVSPFRSTAIVSAYKHVSSKQLSEITG